MDLSCALGELHAEMTELAKENTDLLEALKGLLTWVTESFPDEEDQPTYEIEQARAAIAKAEARP